MTSPAQAGPAQFIPAPEDMMRDAHWCSSGVMAPPVGQSWTSRHTAHYCTALAGQRRNHSCACGYGWTDTYRRTDGYRVFDPAELERAERGHDVFSVAEQIAYRDGGEPGPATHRVDYEGTETFRGTKQQCAVYLRAASGLSVARLTPDLLRVV